VSPLRQAVIDRPIVHFKKNTLFIGQHSSAPGSAGETAEAAEA
jgi:hypothetical protein